MANNAAVHFLNKKIEEQGEDQEILAPDSQMRMLLMPMMMQTQGEYEVLQKALKAEPGPVSMGFRVLS